MAASDYIIAGQPTPPTDTMEIPSGPIQSRQRNVAGDTNQAIIDAIIATESSKNPNAIGKAGELGLMQIKPSTAMQFGVTPPQLFDPKINRQVGTRYFNMLLSRYNGDAEKALMAYNAGPGNVDRGRIPDSARKYAQKVLRAAGSTLSKIIGEGTADAAETPPLPKAFFSASPSGSVPAAPSGTPALPKSFTTAGQTAPAKPLPWAVRAADWAPMVGQYGGEAAAGLAAAPESAGLAAPLAAAGGGMIGNDLGERLDAAVRRHYGLPASSQGDILTSDLISGGSGIALPWLLTPSARGVVTKATHDYHAATAEADKAISGLEKLLGQTKGAAANDAARASAARPFKDAVVTASNSAFEGLNKIYGQVLGPFNKNVTNGSLTAAFMNGRADAQAVGLDFSPALKQKILSIQGRLPTVQEAQDIKSMASREARMLSDDKKPLIAAYDKVADAAKADVKSALPPHVAQRYDELNRRYAETVTQFGKANKIMHDTPNLPNAADMFFKQENSVLSAHLDALNRLPPPVRDRQLAGLRQGFASRILKKVNQAPDYLSQMSAARKAVESTPENIFQRLYGGTVLKDKKAWLHSLNSLSARQAEYLKNPDQQTAVINALKGYVQTHHYVLEHLRRYGMYELVAMSLGGYELSAGNYAKAGAMLLGAGAMMQLSRSVNGSRWLQKAVQSPTAVGAARAILRGIDAVGAEELKTGVGVGSRGDAQETQSVP